jgi:Protein involved in formate dehydrogenase formation
MQALEASIGESTNPWPLRRERAAELAERYPHAAEMLSLYQALVAVQEAAFLEALKSQSTKDIANFAVEHVLPGIIDATVSSGPAPLRDGVISVFCSADLPRLIRRWLEHEPLTPVETYLARSSASPILEATSLPLVGTAREGVSDRLCPSCGGLPQLSYFAVSGEPLVTGPRYLLCSRCATSWVFSRMTCAGCGESTGTRLPIYQEQEKFPHIRVDGCRSCHRYLLTFDLRRDARAVPIVDELAALPLDLYAIDRGLTKITPNLLGN